MFSAKKVSAFAAYKKKESTQKQKTPGALNSSQSAKTPKKKRRRSSQTRQLTPYSKNGQRLSTQPDARPPASIGQVSPINVNLKVVSPRRLADRQTAPSSTDTSHQNGHVEHKGKKSEHRTTHKKPDNDIEVVNMVEQTKMINSNHESRKRTNNALTTSTPNNVMTGESIRHQLQQQQNGRGSSNEEEEVVDVEEDDDSGAAKKRRQDNRSKVLTKEKFKRSSLQATPASSATGSQKVEALIINPEPPYMFDSLAEGRKCFEWLVHPYKPERFFKELWERKPMVIKRHTSTYFKDLFSTDIFDQILRERALWFGKNVDLTTYVNSERKTHNPPGRAYPTIVWDHYQNGCSVRLLNPQTFCRAVWKLNATLQEYFGSFVGANIYLTPAGSQGFAPHYDDIEAFVLQLEGKKRWRLYNPRSPNEVLPRYSSANFTDKDIGHSILDTVLEAGDLLYFPRGTIHQAETVDGCHSLHMTVSTCQKNTWGDLMELLVPRALESAIENDVEFRESLPRDYMSYTGIANCESDSVEKNLFLAKIRRLFAKLVDHSAVDGAADQMSKKFIHDSLPPLLTKREKLRSIHGSGEQWRNGGVTNAIELNPDTRVKFLRANMVRLLMEENEVRLYFSTDNSREYHLEAVQYMEVNPELAPGIEFLILAYPEFTPLEDLPLETLERKMEVGALLYDKGLIMTDDIIDPEDDY